MPESPVLATALGATRVALGLGYMFAPKAVSRATFGNDIDGPELRVTNRMLGSREVLIGAATITAAQTNSRHLGRILLGAAAGDAWDALAVLSTKGTTSHAKWAVGAVALTAAAVGAFTGSTTRPE
ncbi:hypothetical protein GPX89_32450 [Nocardia sp. ET3-3]|uniref:DUF4267 domain-containing protein n=1 Tax=Nocardia terrae TaxID=2675851 RepID=A0A7K1V5W4_9NOCA|nr:hypothetical protein [Nocardia terrae]MVU81937.1 hypothetical protein [Nocardia terrae]